jgi:hypothetical protein
MELRSIISAVASPKSDLATIRKDIIIIEEGK